MSVLKSEDNKEFLISCNCGCEAAISFKIEPPENDDIFFMQILSANWYTEQEGCIAALKKKIKRIWSIVRNKDYCYSEICMNEDEVKQFKAYISQI